MNRQVSKDQSQIVSHRGLDADLIQSTRDLDFGETCFEPKRNPPNQGMVEGAPRLAVAVLNSCRRNTESYCCSFVT